MHARLISAKVIEASYYARVECTLEAATSGDDAALVVAGRLAGLPGEALS